MLPEGVFVGTDDKNCTLCKSFVSFRDDYFDDMEPDDQGFCYGDSPLALNEGACIEVYCTSFDRDVTVYGD